MRNKSDYDILCFCHLRWKFVFQRPQHLMTRWARERRVFFIEEPLIKEEESNPRIVDEVDATGVHLVTPYLPATTRDVPLVVSGLLRRFLQDHKIVRFVSWHYSPMMLPFSAGLTPLVTVYDCKDEMANFKGADPQLVEY